MLARLAATPAIVGLVIVAACAGLEATRLRVTGAWTLWTAAAILVAFAGGLVARQLWASLFGAAFWIAGTVGLAGLAVVVGWQAVTHDGGSDWSGIASAVLGLVAVACALACCGAAVAAVALTVGWRATARPHRVEVWAVSAVVAAAGLATVGWLVGYRYGYMRLRPQNRCLSDSPRTCSLLIRDAERFTTAERFAFGRHGCEAGDATVCRELTDLLDIHDRAPGPPGPEAAAIVARCNAGQPDLCVRLARHLASIGDIGEATRMFHRACTIDVRSCAEAGAAAVTAGLSPVEEQLVRRGCEDDDAASCRRLLRLAERDGREDEVEDLALKTCLLGDVNDCAPLIVADLETVCPRICEGTSELRLQSCRSCAEEADTKGRRDLADRWLASACRNNDRIACDAQGRRGPAVARPKVVPAT